MVINEIIYYAKLKCEVQNPGQHKINCCHDRKPVRHSGSYMLTWHVPMLPTLGLQKASWNPKREECDAVVG